ncbi:Protein FAR1-RELATED SEQUENCE 5 [Platanthera zijinensis]|uniref:Protein FAR1-RELATED SEQUENCE 5 n=1 Tax=Platanthera zijinensis TaxID=2320716 RepID=A0AAP0BWP6_9ASPA
MDVVVAETNADSTEPSVKEPYVSLVFESVDEAYWFYNSYALNVGFGIKKGSTSKSFSSGDVIARRFECNKSGLKTSKVGEGSSTRAHRLTRVNCKAKLDIRKNKDDKWVVTGFIKEHNHELDTPRKAKRHRSHNILHKDKEVKKLMDQLYSAGMGPAKIARILNETNCNSSISANQVSVHLSEHRKNNIENEGASVFAYLKKQQELDPNFYFDIELDSNLVLRSFFWADSRSRNDFLTFGDVVVFDVTYKTNKFMMPFAPFTGVNHHRQSILFGCALLADETEETFHWLFHQWLKCMFDTAPKVIITDMDGAMYNAIKRVFPQTRHRFCSWHIGKHLVEHVLEIRDSNGDFKKDYYEWFNSKDVNTSEQRWKVFIQKYSIQNNSWLLKMWDRREHWVPAYLKDYFVVGMTSSGRSESINAFFDGFVNSKTQLLEFITQYEKALHSRHQAEEREDFNTMNSVANLFTSYALERFAAEFYTKNMFKHFQQEFKQSLECWYEEINTIGTITTFRVGLSCEDSINWSTVIYDDDNTKVICECAKFETDGFLCKHILHIMIAKKHLQSIPNLYLLKRWSISARNKSNTEISVVSSDIVTPMMKWKLTNTQTNIFNLAITSKEAYDLVMSTLTGLLENVRDSFNYSEPASIASQVGSTTIYPSSVGISIRDPLLVKTKGRPKIASRIESGIEISQSQGKRRTCGTCGGKGHYSTTCPQKDKVISKTVYKFFSFG